MAAGSRRSAGRLPFLGALGNRLSIRGKLIAVFAPLISAIVGFQTIYFPARQAADAKAALTAKAQSITQLVAYDSTAAFDFADVARVNEVFEGAKKDPDLEFVVLFRDDGEPFAYWNLAPAPKWPEVRRRAASRSQLVGDRVLVFSRIESVGGAKGILVAGFSTTLIALAQRQNQVTALVIGLVTLSLALVLTIVFSSYIGRRIARFATVAQQVAEGDLSVSSEAEADAADEIGRLSRSLAMMIDRLRNIVDQIRAASGQVSTTANHLTASADRISGGARLQVQAAQSTANSLTSMATSILRVDGNSKSLAEHVSETSQSMTEMGASIEEVARSSANLARTVGHASTVIEEMTASVDESARNLGALSETVVETTATIQEMTSSIKEVARNAGVLNRASEKAVSTVSEMTSSVKEVAAIAEEADRISKHASEDARRGDEAVATTVQGMKGLSDTMESTASVIAELGKRSQEIGRILGLIEDIADQTNLLALNAAIEAARAGEAGRGFAVVADEVRKLAERSAEATKEIGTLIRQVQEQSDVAVAAARSGSTQAAEGSRRADEAGLALRRILDSVLRSSDLMGQIASSIARQSGASAEVLQTMDDMVSVTQQVATAVQQQATGSDQIGRAMASINEVTARVAHSTKEQAVGGRQVRVAVENMNMIAANVSEAMKEQAQSSRLIVTAVESMNKMTQEVSSTAGEQKEESEVVLRDVENISRVASSNVETAEKMTEATSHLTEQARALATLISTFQM